MANGSHRAPRIAEALPRPADLMRVGPNGGAHRVALRLAISALAPVVVLHASGHPEWSAHALLVSTVAVYGRQRPPWVRLRIQCEVALPQVLSVVGGAALAVVRPAPWLLVVVVAVVSAACATVADLRRWNPPGALFFLFAFAVEASAPNVESTGVVVALAVAMGSAAVVLAVTVLDARFAHPSDAMTSIPDRAPGRVVAAQAVACLVAALVAGQTAVALGLDRPYWAMVSAVVPIVGTATLAQVARASHRLIGTLAGIVPAVLLFQLPLSGLWLSVVLVALMAGTEMLVTRNYACALFFLTPMTIGMALTQPGSSLPVLLADRALETVLGVATALVAIVATHRIRHPGAARTLA